jgi:undecaprenyl pyrophosphate phosphatase UppP
MVEMEYQKEEKKKKEAEEEKQNKFNMVIVLATTAFVMVSTAADAWSLIDVFINEVMKGETSNQVMIYIIVLISIGMFGIFGLLVFLRNIFVKRSDFR